MDEPYVKVNGVWRYVYRAVDQHGQVIDVLISVRRDAAAARRFFQRAITTLKVTPTEVVTDAAAVYPAVLDERVPAAWHHVEVTPYGGLFAMHRLVTRPGLVRPIDASLELLKIHLRIPSLITCSRWPGEGVQCCACNGG